MASNAPTDPSKSSAGFKSRLTGRLGFLLLGLAFGWVPGLVLGTMLGLELAKSSDQIIAIKLQQGEVFAENRILQCLTDFVRTHRRWPTGRGDFVAGLVADFPAQADEAVHDLPGVQVHFALTLADIDPADPARFRGLIEPSKHRGEPGNDEHLLALLAAVAEAKRPPAEAVQPAADAAPSPEPNP